MRFVVLFNFLSVVVLLSVANAAAPTGGYAPNATLDPACAPGDADCFVKALGKFVDGTNPLDASYTAGSVGIGTAVPNKNLHVESADEPVLFQRNKVGEAQTTSVLGLRARLTGEMAGTQGASIGFSLADDSDDNKVGIFGVGREDEDNSGKFFFRNYNAGVPQTNMVISKTGNVGIGTTTPGAKLEVAGQVKITGGVPGAGKVLTSDAVGLATWETPASGADNLGDHIATTNVQLGSNYLSGDGDAEGVAVDAAGNVGIGTTSPSHKLDIRDSAPAIRFTDPDVGEFDGLMSVDANVVSIGSTSVPHLNMDLVSGNVGIGTAVPDTELHVAGFGTFDNQVLIDREDDTGTRQHIQFRRGSIGSSAYVQTTGDGAGNVVDMRMGMNGLTKMTLLDNGNVGIGTTTPGAELEVNGQVKITGGVPGAGKVLTSDAAGLATWTTPASGADNLGNHTATTNVQLGSNYLSGDGDAEGLAVDSVGMVGIGTLAPARHLHIRGTGDVYGLVESTTAAAVWRMKSDQGEWGAFSSGFGDAFQIYDYGTNNIRFNISGTTGNVGIGTTSPSHKLTIEGGQIALDNDTGLIMKTSSGNQRRFFNVDATDELAIGNTGAGDGNDSIRFDVTGLASAMRVTPSGKVGIGTAAPTHKFNVVDGAASLTYDREGGNSVIRIQTSDNTLSPSIKFNNTDEDWSLGMDGPQGDIFSLGQSGFGSRMVVDTSGNMGIGTATPDTRLHVAGFGTFDNQVLVDREDDTATRQHIQFRRGSIGSSAYMQTTGDGSGSVVDMRMGMNGLTKMTLLDNGNVGIGVVSPGSKLEVAGQVKITGGAPGAGKVLTSDAAGLATWEAPASGSDNLGNHTATTNVQLGSNYLSGDGDAEGVAVDATGNVGIGTTSPSVKLHIDDGSSGVTPGIYSNLFLEGSRSYIELATPSNGIGALQFSDPELTGVGAITYNHATNAMLLAAGNSGAKLSITSAGNVGIGVVSPGSKLSVVGLPSGTTDAATAGTLAGAVCITDIGNMYIDTDGTCAN